ncbi:succinate dehydrogenase assembly factor 2 [Curvibacter sp. CHRR-16]|uniref:FAD assembly factor SdhE n=1 Tax=Curvibacter sp. CHRR-16 TaxID=2835872 RepID=UPI001BDA33AF|nr:succinate dehydrogenase assembly factor 2 [Curvibacter sp. CHRR-16]MBT0571624.1 succinate dehydrogenase assembly factor 2 [Curvibacter sp. CHRR-16]
MTAVLDEQDINRLRWRCRRGLLENDIFIERFFANHAQQLTRPQADALLALMELSDNDLLDLHLERKALQDVAPQLDHSDVRDVLTKLRQPLLT